MIFINHWFIINKCRRNNQGNLLEKNIHWLSAIHNRIKLLESNPFRAESTHAFLHLLYLQKAAIKKMDMQASKEFLAELKVLTHVHHLNLVINIWSFHATLARELWHHWAVIQELLWDLINYFAFDVSFVTEPSQSKSLSY